MRRRQFITLLGSTMPVMIFIGILVCSRWAVSAEPVCVKRANVLITAFAPWANAPRNGSEEVAKSILKNNSDSPSVHYSYCLLPVSLENATKEALNCFDQTNPKPDMMISLGEGKIGECRIELDTHAHNLRRLYAPNQWRKKVNNPDYDKNLPVSEVLDYPVIEMYCSPGAKVAPMRVSYDPGEDVCNQVAYKMSRYLAPKAVPFGFIHVPVPECGFDPHPIAAKLHRMIEAGAKLVLERNERGRNGSLVREISTLSDTRKDSCKLELAKVLDKHARSNHRRFMPRTCRRRCSPALMR
jgi:pyrrolidone-carboxylate peptidase